MYPFFETIRITDAKPVNLEYHQRRLNRTLEDNYKQHIYFDLVNILTKYDFDKNKTIKCRFLYNNIDYKIEFEEYCFSLPKIVYIAKNDKISYEYKFSDRSMINSMKNDFVNNEILIIKNSLVTDTSISNIVFKKGESWETPLKPLLSGTERQKLLDEKKIITAEIYEDDIYKYEAFKLINAMNSFENATTLPIDIIQKK